MVDVSEATPVVSSNAIASGINVILAKGDKGANVKTLQRALNALGYRSGKIDGTFGANTQKSLMKFQSAMGLSASGILDDATKAQFKIKGYEKGGLVDYTGLAMVHGSSLKKEYVQSAPAVESMLDSIPTILAKMASGDGGITIEEMTVIANNPPEFMRQMKNLSYLDKRTQRGGR
jgi:hypothetical protein